MARVLDWIMNFKSFLECYPSWVKALVALWLILTPGILLAFLLANGCPPEAVAVGSTVDSPPPQVLRDGPRLTVVFTNIEVNGVSAQGEWQRIDLPVQDKKGKEMTVSIGVLSDPYRWVLNSTSDIQIGGEKDLPVEEVLAGLPEGETRPIIAVGTASHENAIDHPQIEEARAGERADRLVSICREKYPDADIYSINLGYFLPEASNSAATSSSERRVILLVIQSWEEGANFSEGVFAALEKASRDQRFVFDASKYSRFTPDAFKLTERSPWLRTPKSVGATTRAKES
jgi:hypothetical protein